MSPTYPLQVNHVAYGAYLPLPSDSSLFRFYNRKTVLELSMWDNVALKKAQWSVILNSNGTAIPLKIEKLVIYYSIDGYMMAM